MKTTLFDSSDAVLVLIDYQDEMFSKVRSCDPKEVEMNIKLLVKSAEAMNMPIILSTVGVEMKANGPTRESIKTLLPDSEEIDRTSMNAWEDEKFRQAVISTGRKHLIVCALWTEICLAFPVIDALKEGFQVMIPVDAVGGISHLTHQTAVDRMIQAGAVPSTTLATMTELFRDWKDERAAVMRPLIVQHFKDVSMILKRSTGEGQVYS